MAKVEGSNPFIRFEVAFEVAALQAVRLIVRASLIGQSCS